MWKRFINGDIYRDVPTPLLFVVGPLVGLTYLLVLPLIGIVSLILLPFYKFRKVKTSPAALHRIPRN